MSLMFGGGFSKTQADGGDATIEHLDLVSSLSVVGGFDAGRYNSTGKFNLIFGYEASADPTSRSGSHNVALGTYAAFKNRGDFNTWVGSRAGVENAEGSENVGVGWHAGGRQTSSRGNTSLGYESGADALGDGNVSLGHGANASGESFDTSCNIAVGSSAQASGGDSVAVGADTVAEGAASVALGAANTASGAGSLVAGSYISSSGAGSLVLLPTRGSAPYASTADRELNVFGVLTGSEKQGGRYEAAVRAESVSLVSEGARLDASNGALSLSASSNIAILSTSMFGGRASFNADAVFSERAVFVGGMHGGVTSESVFDGPVRFNGPVGFGSAASLALANVEAQSLVAGELMAEGLVVTGHAELPENALPDPLFQTARVLGDSTFYGKAVFKSGIHVCCAPVRADTVEAHTTRTHHLYVDGEFSVSNARVSISDLAVDSGTFDRLVSDKVYVLSNLSVAGDLTGTGALYFSSAFFGGLSASSANFTGQLTADAMYTSNIVCDTITVTGQNTLKVLGTSILNGTETNTLRVNSTSSIRDMVVDENAYIGKNTNTETLTVRAGTVMSTLTADRLTTDKLDAREGRVRDLETHDVTGVNAAFSNLDVGGPLTVLGPLAADSVAAVSNVTGASAAFDQADLGSAVADILRAGAASVCNLTVQSLELLGGLDVADLSLNDMTLTGTTTVVELVGQGNALFQQDVTVDGKLTVGEIEVSSGFSLNTGLPVIFDDALIANQELIVRGNARLEGHLEGTTAGFSGAVSAASLEADGDVSTGGCVRWVNGLNAVAPYQWDACLVNATATTADLRFKSHGGTTFTLCDEFETGVLNFTGKHRCSAVSREGLEPGMVLVSTGVVENLDGGSLPTLDEALPVVGLSRRRADAAAFGVFAGSEPRGDRVFRLANMVFRYGEGGGDKVVVNSVGEGGMWVCDENGEPAPGDLLCTSSVPGHAERQGDDVVRACTVAKVTAPGRWVDYPRGGCRRAFAGVVYRF